MTPADLLADLALAEPRTPWPSEPAALLRAVEARAEAAPGDPSWTGRALAAERLALAEVPLPAGLRRETLVRADAVGVTWTARDPDGERWMVRAPWPGASSAAQRALARDGRALIGVVGGLMAVGDAWLAPAPGGPLRDAVPAPGRPARWLAQAFGALADWARAGLAPRAPHPEELRVAGDPGDLRIVTLTPGPADPGPTLDALAAAMVADGAAGRVLDGLRALPAGAGEELADRLRAALADELAERSVGLRRRAVALGQRDRRARLIRAMDALAAALPPPTGRGGVGYDLEGRPTAVESDGRLVRWGPDGSAELVWDATGFRPVVARRLLRACAAAPTTAALQRETGGTAEAADSLGRWVSAGLKLRTTRMLLDATGG